MSLEPRNLQLGSIEWTFGGAEMGKGERMPLGSQHLRPCTKAAQWVHLEVLEWARENGCPWGEQACTRAAEHGRLEVLKWLRANGFPWDKNTCHAAAFGNRWEMLRWVRVNGCPWGKSARKWAAENGYVE
ncbi:Ankyrin repeat domain-containing protein [Balamuthia mandrillaris]